MKNQPFILPLAGLMSGILFAEFFPTTDLADIIKILCAFILLIFLFYFIYKRTDSVWIFGVFFLIGFIYFVKFNSYQPLSETQIDNEVLVQLEIKEIYKPSEKFRKYKAKILQIDSIPNENHVLLYWKRENAELFPKDEVWLRTKIFPTQKPLNPHQFYYAKWLRRQNIHYTIFSDTVYRQSQTEVSYFQFSKYKRKVHQKLLANGYSKSSADLIGAMLLGDRTEMNPQLEENYRKAGVVHILSISGLHVMMVYSIFMILLYPLIFLRNGKTIRILLSLALIWSFVVFVGFQPPVLRSAVMISVFYITITFKRKPNVYHTLSVSALILLLINPNFLLDVGFQLSFSAVFFIVYLHPIYQKLFRPKNKIAKWSVAFLGTSISAQLGTFPIAAYYFHQTSGLFLAGNLAMILASYGMIWGGIVSLALLEINAGFSFWTDLFNGFIKICNQYIEWISSFDAFVFENISFRLFEVILLLIGIVFIRIIWEKPQFKWVLAGVFILFLFQIQNFIRSHQFAKKNEIIVFHQSRNSVIGVRNGFEMEVFVREMEDSNDLKKYLINPYAIHEGIRKVELKNMENGWAKNYFKTDHSIYYEGKHLIWTNGKNLKNGVRSDFVLIQGNSDLNFDSVSPQTHIIMDGSNYPNHLKNAKVPVWRTREKGAMIIEFD